MSVLEQASAEQADDDFQFSGPPRRQFTDSEVWSMQQAEPNYAEIQENLLKYLRRQCPNTATTMFPAPGLENSSPLSVPAPSADSVPTAAGLLSSGFPSPPLVPSRISTELLPKQSPGLVPLQPSMSVDPADVQDIFDLPAEPWRQYTDPTQYTSHALQSSWTDSLEARSSAEGLQSSQPFVLPEQGPRLMSTVHEQHEEVQAPAQARPPDLEGKTTVMIRHIPPKLTQKQLQKEVNELGYSNKFDFLYIPMDSRRRANRGIAFINFISGEDAQSFAEQQHENTLRTPLSVRPVEIMPADLQGFEENVKHHEAALQNPSDTNRPLVLRRGAGSGGGGGQPYAAAGGTRSGAGPKAKAQAGPSPAASNNSGMAAYTPGQRSEQIPQRPPTPPPELRYRVPQAQAWSEGSFQPGVRSSPPQPLFTQQSQLLLSQDFAFRGQADTVPTQPAPDVLPRPANHSLGSVPGTCSGGAQLAHLDPFPAGAMYLAPSAQLPISPQAHFSALADGQSAPSSEVRFCTFCGAPRGTDYWFCPRCGTKYPATVGA